MSRFWLCADCGKRTYGDRRQARAAAKTIGGPHMTAYRCPAGPGWHLGHMPRDVVHGLASKDDYQAHVQRRRRRQAS